MEEIKRSLSDSLRLVLGPGVAVELTAAIVVDLIEEEAVFWAVEGCSDVKGSVLKLVCAADDIMMSKLHFSAKQMHRTAGTHSMLSGNPR